MHRGRAGSDDDAVQVVLFDRLLDERLTGVGAHILVVGGVDDTGIVEQRFGHLLHVHRASDVESAVTDKNADTSHPTLPSPDFANGRTI